MSNEWKSELKENAGKVLLPDNRWVEIDQSLLRVWDGDVWSDPRIIIAEPEYEQGIARFMESVVAAGYCGSSDSARFNFIHQHLTIRATGDLFDFDSLYIDRETLPKFPQEEVTICDAFGKSPRRTMTRLKAKACKKRSSVLHGKLLQRMCWLSIARKEFLSRAGYPEFCEPFAP